MGAPRFALWVCEKVRRLSENHITLGDEIPVYQIQDNLEILFNDTVDRWATELGVTKSDLLFNSQVGG